MKLADVRGAYQDLSEKASDSTRQLAFAGVAIVWVFHNPQNTGPRLPPRLLPVLLAFGLVLAFDLLHYAIASVFWGVYHRCKERCSTESDDFKAPCWLNWPADLCYFVKVVALVVGYVLLIQYLCQAWHAQ